MGSSKHIDLVCFDLDGVMVDTNDTHIKAWKETALQLNIEPGNFLSTLGKSVGLSSDLIASKLLGIDKPRDLKKIKELKREIFHALIKKEGCRIFSDAYDLACRLREDGYNLALVSTSSSAKYIASNTGIAGLFDLALGGHDSKKGKPAPDLYIKAISHFEARLTVALEDTTPGLESARAAGCYCIGIRRGLLTEELAADSYLDTGFQIDSNYLENKVSGWSSKT